MIIYSYFKVALSVFFLSILVGCRADAADQDRKSNSTEISPTYKPNSNVGFWAVTIKQKDEKLYVSGRLKMRGLTYGPAYGHVVVRIIDRGGKTLSQHHMRTSTGFVSQQNSPSFSGSLPVTVNREAGESIELAYTGETMAESEHRIEKGKS